MKVIKLIFLVTFLSGKVFAESVAIQEARNHLSPIVQSVLTEQCGDRCPGFLIEPALGAQPSGSESESLGFSTASKETTDVSAIRVSILVDPEVQAPELQTLRQVLQYRLSNEVSVPVQVGIRKTKGPAPELPVKEAKNRLAAWFEMAKAVLWPVAILTLGLFSLFALLFYFSYKKRMHALMYSPQVIADPALEEKDNEAEVTALGEALMLSRANDAKWWIESKAAEGDKEQLSRLFSLCPYSKLSETVDLSGGALEALSKIPEKHQPGKEDLAWLEQELDKARIASLHETKNPMAVLKRISPKQLRKFFQQLPMGIEKGALLSHLPKQRWALLISELSSEDRVQLGKEMHGYLTLSAEKKVEVGNEMTQLIRQWTKTAQDVNEDALSELTFYLTDNEVQKLGAYLSENNRPLKALDIDSLILKLEKNALIEIAMVLETPQIRSLIGLCGKEAAKHLTSSLPRAMRERVLSTPNNGADSEAMKLAARAGFFSTYHQLFGDQK